MKTTFSLKIELDSIQDSITLNSKDFKFQTITIEKTTSIKERLNKSNGSIQNTFDFNQLESDRIYSLSAIKKICLANRLRFLDTRFYKNEYPEAVIQSIKEFEELHQTQLHHFKIVAPKSNFKLHNYDDPLLFMSLGNDYYYLLDYWGNDLHWTRKIKALPLKNLFNLTLFTVVISILLTYFIQLFKTESLATSYQIIVFLFTWKSVIAIVFYSIIKTGNNVSEYNWNSEFYNK